MKLRRILSLNEELELLLQSGTGLVRAVQCRAGAEYSNIRSVGWLSILRFKYLFMIFLNPWHPPRNGSLSRLNMNHP